MSKRVRFRFLGLWAAVAVLSNPAPARASWTIEAMLGNAVNLPTTLTIDLEGEPMLRHSAEWESRGFESPIYYAVRVGRGDENRAWAVDFVHHKVLLGNPPAEVQHYEVSHGLNVLALNRMFLRGRWHAATGIGVVVAHPESVVEGVPLTGDHGADGYVLTGPALQVTGGYRQPFARRWLWNVEARVLGAHVRVPVARGWSSFQNVSLHVLVGVGWSSTR